jgi:hypothetical protein
VASPLLWQVATRSRRKEIVMEKRMFKVLSPIEKPNGERWWLRCGTGFRNKDDSLNLYLNALPVVTGKELTLQVREMTEEDFTPNRTRAAFQLPRSASMPPGSANPASSPPLRSPAPGTPGLDEPVPF